ncbi:MAG: hypothetical protein RIQ66_802 [Pseudomonadota bacterium]|jgi:hypothetical protein
MKHSDSRRAFRQGPAGVLACLLAGCAATVPVWVHPDRPGVGVEVDAVFCETAARAEVIRPQASPPLVNLTGLASVIRMMDQAALDREFEAEVQRHLAECLRKKGWRLSEAR